MHGTSSGITFASAMRDAPDRGLLLSGLVVDANGLAMTLSRRTAGGVTGSLYYVSRTTGGERIPATRLERCAIAVLNRVGVLAQDWQQADLVEVLRRVVVYSDCLELQLNARACLVRWRDRQPRLVRANLTKMLRAIEGMLAQGEIVSVVGNALSLSTPRYSRNRSTHDRRRLLAGSSCVDEFAGPNSK